MFRPSFLDTRNKLNLMSETFFWFRINIVRTCHQQIFWNKDCCPECKPWYTLEIHVVALRFPSRANNSNWLHRYSYVFNLFIVFILMTCYGEFLKIMAAAFWFKFPPFLIIFFTLHQLQNIQILELIYSVAIWRLVPFL
jgi:hypothetical protein